jgi:hypothetical protein
MVTNSAYLQSPAEGLWAEGSASAHQEIVILEVMVETIDLPG